MVKLIKARLLESWEIAPEVRHFIFEVPSVEDFPFAAGQFVSLVADIKGQPITRAYSVASPAKQNRFELCLNRVEGGHMSPHLFDLQPGDEIDMKGPYGVFTLRQPVLDTIMVATGTGVAPFRAILIEHLPKDPEHHFLLILGSRYENLLLYKEEFEELEKAYPNFRFWPTVTRPTEAWQGRTGRVQPHMWEAIGERRDLHVYICGLKEMVDEVRAQLKEAGFDRKHIIFEKYD